jgi:hypothetical protein
VLGLASRTEMPSKVERMGRAIPANGSPDEGTHTQSAQETRRSTSGRGVGGQKGWPEARGPALRKPSRRCSEWAQLGFQERCGQFLGSTVCHSALLTCWAHTPRTTAPHTIHHTRCTHDPPPSKDTHHPSLELCLQ